MPHPEGGTRRRGIEEFTLRDVPNIPRRLLIVAIDSPAAPDGNLTSIQLKTPAKEYHEVLGLLPMVIACETSPPSGRHCENSGHLSLPPESHYRSAQLPSIPPVRPAASVGIVGTLRAHEAGIAALPFALGRSRGIPDQNQGYPGYLPPVEMSILPVAGHASPPMTQNCSYRRTPLERTWRAGDAKWRSRFS